MRLFVFLLCFALAGSPSAWAQAGRLPDLGDGSEMTLGAERRIGDNIAREIYRDPDYVDDPVLGDYVQTIWRPLLASARRRGELLPEMEQQYAWAVSLIRDPSVNAFALPGGYLGVHLGLISAVSSADELAAVLGHELTHVLQRHIARSLEQQGRQSPLVIGAMILGMLAASRGGVNSSNINAANALLVGGQAAAIQSQLNFSRDMEREADRIGYSIMTDAGFAPQSFVTMFEKLQQASRLNDNGSYPYLRSHPMTTERIADAQARQQLLPSRTPVPLMPQHAMMAARARVLVNPGVDRLHAMSMQADAKNVSSAAQAGALYAGVMAEIRLRDFDAARRHLAQLQAVGELNAAAQHTVRLLAVELALAMGNATEAVAQLDGKVSLVATQDRAGHLALAQSRIATQNPAQLRRAAQDLVVWVNQQPRDAQAWDLLASCYQEQGDALRSIRAQAEARMAQLDYAAAFDRLKAGQALAQRLTREGKLDRPGNVEASIIDARLRESERLRREQSLQR